MRIVAKFGGSSVADAEGFKRVKTAISGQPVFAVITSAYGKRKGHLLDDKATDLLYTIIAHVQHGVQYQELWNIFCERFISIKTQLNLKTDIQALLSNFQAELTKTADVSYVVSRGEYFTAILLAEYLGFTFVDALDTIIFDCDGKLNLTKTKQNLTKAEVSYGKFVMGGFYGGTQGGFVRLLDRGGSDTSGSIVAAVLNADLYQIWTDVDGIYAADPNLIQNPAKIKQLSYRQLRELSYSGATVVHYSSVSYAFNAKVPIAVLNTFDPKNDGTLIDCTDAEGVVGIAAAKDFVSFNVWLANMSGQIGFVQKALNVFHKHQISIEHLPTSIDGISIVVKAADIIDKQELLTQSLKKALSAEVSVTKNIGLASIVGTMTISVTSSALACLDDCGIQPQIILQSPDRLNLVLGIPQDKIPQLTQALYDKLFC